MFALAVDAKSDDIIFRGPDVVVDWPKNKAKDPPTHRIPQVTNQSAAFEARFEQIAADLLELIPTSNAIMNVQVWRPRTPRSALIVANAAVHQ